MITMAYHLFNIFKINFGDKELNIMRPFIKFYPTQLTIILSLFIMLFISGYLHADSNVELAFPDAYEIDDSPGDAPYFNHNSITYQLHNFHKENDADWVRLYALEFDPIEIKTYDTGYDCTTVISIYDTDGISLITKSVRSLSDGTNLVSFRPPLDGTDGVFFVKITNKDQSMYGRDATYKLSIYKPVTGTMGIIDGIITSEISGRRIENVMVSTPSDEVLIVNDEGVLVAAPFDKVLSLNNGFYYIACPVAGQIDLIAQKTGYQKYQTTVTMGEEQMLELNIALTPSYTYSSNYTLAQWGLRGSDAYYCVDICDLNGTPYPGLQKVECGENFNAWSAKHYINIILGIPDSALSGLQFMWKVWSPTGYGGEGFEGVITVP